ncbi:exonuclease domain-containing protein, partial [Acinetobacter baumannii]|uniref:exonuclease domain-containing protein n=1 Tax=Acinetobacter baumannii TaxID=470 RepID=UPI00224BA824
DEIIELGITAFTFSESRIGDVIGRFSSFRDPSFPIPEEITALTGITNEMVKGHVIPLDQVREIVEPATLVTAHNAGFDRGFCERLDPI